MRPIFSACLALSLCGGAAFAQTPSGSTTMTTGASHPSPTMTAPATLQDGTSTKMPAPAAQPHMTTAQAGMTQPGKTPAGDAKGANSFTESQARSRLEGNGYSNVSALTKDPNGIWRGTAMIGGTSKQVGVDYKGEISAH